MVLFSKKETQIWARKQAIFFGNAPSAEELAYLGLIKN